MIKVTRISGQNSNMFLPAVDTLTLAVCDILLGAYDMKTDTACGILAAESVRNEKLGYCLAIRQIFVDEAWRRKKAGTKLVDALMDIAMHVGAKAVLCCHLETGEGGDPVSRFFEALAFKRTQDALPVYGFRLAEIDAGKDHEEITCVPLKDTAELAWKGFVGYADKRSAVINVRSYYDERISFLAYDKNAALQGAILVSFRNGVLFVDELLSEKEGKIRILEALICHAVTEANKFYSPATEIGIILADREQETNLYELTGFHAEKLGSFVVHVVQ